MVWKPFFVTPRVPANRAAISHQPSSSAEDPPDRHVRNGQVERSRRAGEAGLRGRRHHRGGWSVWSDADSGYVWREDRIAELLGREEEGTLYVSGTVSNQGRFYPRFDAVVLLHAPAETILDRIATRATNDYGKSADERALVLQQLAEVEPLLRATCTHEIDATQPLEVVVGQLVAIGRDARG
jgi:hypothetical protein